MHFCKGTVKLYSTKSFEEWRITAPLLHVQGLTSERDVVGAVCMVIMWRESGAANNGLYSLQDQGAGYSSP